MKKLVTVLLFVFLPTGVYAQSAEELISVINLKEISIHGLLVAAIWYLYSSGNQNKKEYDQKMELKDAQLKESNDKMYNLQINYLTTLNDFKVSLSENNRIIQENGRILEKLTDKLE